MSIVRVLAIAALFTASGPLVRAQEVEPPMRPDPDGEYERHREMLEEDQERFSEEYEEGETEGENPAGRYEWFTFQRRFPYPAIPAGIRANAVRATQQMELRMAQAAANVKGPTVAAAEAEWTNIGPFNIAGRIRAIVVDPSASNTIFVGAANGGVWKNSGNVLLWTTHFDKQSSLTIGAMAMDPSNANVIYAGTGEVVSSPTSVFNSTPSYFGDGVFKSTDGGESWFHSGLANLGTTSGLYVRKDNPNIVYLTSAYGAGGFYKSTDAGASWTLKRSGGFYSLTVNHENENILLIASAGQIFRSIDGGETFTTATGYSPGNALRTSVGLAPSNPSIGYALVAMASTTSSDNRNTAAVYKTTNGGSSWSQLRTFGGSFFNAQGYYNNCIAVHPTDPNQALIGGIDIYRTTDGGTNWTNTTRSYTGGNVHPDQHVLAYDPKNPVIVYLGNDGGVYVSYNSGATWSELGLSLPITQYYEIGVDQSRSYRAFGGAQDNGTQVALDPSRWAHDWDDILGGDGFHVIADESDNNYVYAESQYGAMSRVHLVSFGASYVTSNMDRESSSDYDPGSWSTPIAMSPVDKQSLYTGRRNLWKSTNRGATWTGLVPGASANISAIGLSNFDAKDIVVGTSVGEVFYTTDGGATWKSPVQNSGDPDFMPRRYVTEILFDPVVENRVYVVISGSGDSKHVFRSDNNGQNFVDVSGNLPDIPTSAFAIDPQNNQHLFVGNDVGVFVSLDGGRAWLPFNNGLPYVPVVDMEIHRARRMLIAGTHGRSMFEISIDNPQPQPIVLTPNGGQTYQTGDTISISWAGFSEPVYVLVSYDGGQTFDTLATLNNSSDLTYLAPLVRSTNAVVRVVAVGSGISVDSNPFVVSPKANLVNKGNRGVLVGAMAIKGKDVWAADRESDQVILYRLPTLLPLGQKVTRTGMTGTVIDMAYDAGMDKFFVLTGSASDRVGDKLFVMNTTGGTDAQLPLPATDIVGVAVGPDGLTVISSGPSGILYQLDPSSGGVISQSDPLANGSGEERVGLVWDGKRFDQVINDIDPGALIPDVLQQISSGSSPSVTSTVPLVLDGTDNLDPYGLAYDGQSGTSTNGGYLISDAEGNIYFLAGDAVGSVGSGTIRNYESSVAIRSINPNPVRSRSQLELSTAKGGTVRVDVYNVEGLRVAVPFDGRLAAGTHVIEIDLAHLPSGSYQIVLTGPEGDRDIRTAYLVR